MDHIVITSGKRNWFWISFGIIAFLYAVAFSLLPSESIWISDEGNRLMSVQAYAMTGTSTLPDPLQSVEAVPSGIRAYPKPYFIQKNGVWRSAYSLLFPYLASFVYVPGMEFLLYGIALVFGLLTVLFTGFLGKEIFQDERKSILCMGLCAFGTPVLFYSGTFLETTCASFFSMAALYILIYTIRRTGTLSSMKRLTLYGVCALLMGIGILFREEGFVFATGVGAGLVICYFDWKNLLVMGLCGAIPAAGLFLYNYMDSGSIFGMHSRVYDSLGKPSESFWVFGAKNSSFFLFLLCLPVMKWWNLVFPWIFPAGVGGAFVRRIRPWVLCGGMGIIFVSTLFSNYWNVTAEHGGVFIYQSLVDHLPLAGGVMLCMGLLLYQKEKVTRFLTVLCVFCIVITPFLLNHSQIGMFWGGRHFLNIAGVLCILAVHIFYGEKEYFSKGVKMGMAALMGLSVIVNICGYCVLKMKRDFSASYVRELGREEVKVILTDVFFFPEEIAMLNRRKTVLLLTEKDSLEQAAVLLKKNQIRNFHLVLGRRSRVLSNESIRRCMKMMRLEPLRHFSHRSFGFFEVQIFHCTLL